MPRCSHVIVNLFYQIIVLMVGQSTSALNKEARRRLDEGLVKEKKTKVIV